MARRLWRALLGPLAASLTWAVQAAAAGGARVEYVTLKDGSSYQGELVEKIVGDNVTVRLATGAVKRFAWADVAASQTIPDSSPAPAEAAQGVATGPAPPAPLSREAADLTTRATSSDALPSVSWPEPDRTRGPYDGSRLFIAAGSALSMHDGYLIGTVAYEWRWIGLDVGAGYGGAFGPSIRETLRLGLITVGPVRIGFGVGGTQAFLTRGAGPQARYVGAPEVGDFVNFDGSLDVRIYRGLRLRGTVGPSLLVDAGSYAAMCPNAPNDCARYAGGRPDPWTVGAAESAGQSKLFINSRLELGWAFGL